MAKLSEIVRTNGKCLKCGRPSGDYALCGICYYDKKMQEAADRRRRLQMLQYNPYD
jgi:NMD protein affecting ribosome stability and mRNA decay